MLELSLNETLEKGNVLLPRGDGTLRTRDLVKYLIRAEIEIDWVDMHSYWQHPVGSIPLVASRW